MKLAPFAHGIFTYFSEQGWGGVWGGVDWRVYEPELPADCSHQCIPQLVLHTSLETFSS